MQLCCRRALQHQQPAHHLWLRPDAHHGVAIPFYCFCCMFRLLDMECCVVPGGACVIPALPFKQAPIEKPIPANEKAARKADEQGQ